MALWKKDRAERDHASAMRMMGDRILWLLAVLGLGLALGACTKCDVPTWQPNKPSGTPLSCHGDAPSPQS